MEPIRSRQNSLLKRVVALASGKDRGALLLQGERLVAEAVAMGVDLELVLAAEGTSGAVLEDPRLDRSVVRTVEPTLLRSLSTLESGTSCLAIAPVPALRDPSSLHAHEGALVLVVCGVSDPGNLGALARSAEAAGAEALVHVAGSASPWNPKALRGSMGSLLRLPVVQVPTAEDLANELAQAGWRQVAASTRGGSSWRQFDWTGPVALWISGERGDELPPGLSLESVSIPLAGQVESLNVAAAGALLLFAAGRSEP